MIMLRLPFDAGFSILNLHVLGLSLLLRPLPLHGQTPIMIWISTLTAGFDWNFPKDIAMTRYDG